MSLLLLLDGNSLAYRAFFALPTDMATAAGQVTNAVFGFTSMLVNLLKDHHPDQIAVAFDRPEPTFRHEMIDDYKAGRAEATDILPGEPGVRERPAANLLTSSGSLEGISAQRAALPPTLRQTLAGHEAQVRKNAEATPLLRDVPIDADPADLVMGGWDIEEVRRLFTFLEFRTLWDRLLEAVGQGGEKGGQVSPEAGAPLTVGVVRPGTAAEV